MNRIKCWIVFSLLGLSLNAQEPGYFGKRSFLEVDGQAQLPVVLYLLNNEKGYVVKDGAFQKSLNLKDVGFRASFGRYWTENMAIAFEFNQRFYQVNPLRGGELNRQFEDAGVIKEEYIRPEVEFLQISERMLMPKLIFSPMDGRVPGGLTHEIGVGYSIIGIMNRSAAAGYTPDSLYTGEEISSLLTDPSIGEFKGLTFMYGLRMNYPLTRSILFHAGMRYSYAWLLDKKDIRKTEQTAYWLSGRELWSRINQKRQLGIINFGCGFTICF